MYRMIVPLMKVGSIIGKKGETVKKLCVETGARVNVLPGLVTCPHRVVSASFLSSRVFSLFLFIFRWSGDFVVVGTCDFVQISDYDDFVLDFDFDVIII